MMCNITGYSYGAIARKGVILTMEQSGQVVPITLTIPVSGYYIPGTGFVPIFTLVLLTVVIIIIILLLIILLVEYSNWRRRRIAKLLGPPG
jgi:membrane protein YdbS with pleckstrin-like domain